MEDFFVLDLFCSGAPYANIQRKLQFVSVPGYDFPYPGTVFRTKVRTVPLWPGLSISYKPIASAIFSLSRFCIFNFKMHAKNVKFFLYFITKGFYRENTETQEKRRENARKAQEIEKQFMQSLSVTKKADSGLFCKI